MGLATAQLHAEEFDRLASFIQGSIGIKMPPHKQGLLELRLGKRLRALGLDSFKEYCEFVFDNDEHVGEVYELIDAVTTNKTDFFREPEHFDRLTGHVLPELLGRDADLGGVRPLRVWSSACSSGEEPYTLAMVLSDYGDRLVSEPFEFAITASDLSSAMLRFAARAVYPRRRVDSVPEPLLHRYMLRGTGECSDLVRVAPELRRAVNYCRVNLVEEYPFRQSFDIIFCRNVLIYFERGVQIDILSRMCDLLEPGGYLFVGHSETLHGMGLPLEHRGPTVYRKVGR